MLNENIKMLRKSKGLSQEELAVKLNVVRQTISKWENGLSVPDSDMLISIRSIGYICRRSAGGKYDGTGNGYPESDF